MSSKLVAFQINGRIYLKTNKKTVVDCGGGALTTATKDYKEISAMSGRIAEKADEWNKVNKIAVPSGYKRGDFLMGNDEETLYEKNGKIFSMQFEHFNGHLSNFKSGVWKVVFTELKEWKNG
jgi:hypothetical protein